MTSARPLRVGYDATGWRSTRGPGRFVRNLLRRLAELDDDAEYVAIVERGEPLAGIASRVRRHEVNVRGDRRSRTLGDLVRLGRAARSLDLDVFLFPYVATWFPVVGAPSVVGVYDVIADSLPAMHLRGRFARSRWRLKESVAVRTARRVFTISEASRLEVAERFGFEASRVAVVSGAPEEAFFPRARDDVDPVLAHWGLRDGAYLLCSGAVAPRKNLDAVIDAYASIRSDGGAADRLVVVGEPRHAEYVRALGERARRLGVEEQIVFTGFVSDDALACLYTSATAFVTASVAEGFGLPAVEAAACGAPVVLSDLPAHRETLGEAGVFFAAASVESLDAALRGLVDDPARREALGEAARRASSALSWEPGVKRLRELIAEAASG